MNLLARFSPACLSVLVGFFVPSMSFGLDFKLVGETLIMSGSVVSDDLARLKDHLGTKQVKLALLHNSPGGDLWNGFELSRRIREAGVDTAVSGKCASACGVIFLGGVGRYFSDGRTLDKTMIGLHGAHHRETKVALPQVGARMQYVIRDLTDQKFPEELLKRIVYSNHPEDITYVFHPKRFPADGKPRGVVECLRQVDPPFKCTPVEGQDALLLGIITSTRLIELDAQVRAALPTP